MTIKKFEQQNLKNIVRLINQHTNLLMKQEKYFDDENYVTMVIEGIEVYSFHKGRYDLIVVYKDKLIRKVVLFEDNEPLTYLKPNYKGSDTQ